MKTIHFISVLGAGNYIPTLYGNSKSEEEYVQIAIAKKLIASKKADENLRVTVFCTEVSKEKHWNNKLEIQFNDLLGEIGNVECVDIPFDKNTKRELMQVFSIIADSMDENEEIVFDVTHAFRSIPMIALSALVFARTIKNVKVKRIFYGAFEAKDDEGRAPLIDLKAFLDIIDWSQAASSFVKYGSSDEIHDITQKSQNEYMRNMGDCLYGFTHGLETSRGRYRRNAGQDNENSSYYYSAKEFLEEKNEYLNNPRHGDESLEKPWVSLLDIIADKMEEFNTSGYDPVKQGLAAVKWAIANKRTQQGYTALEETVKTFLCKKYELDVAERSQREATKIVCFCKSEDITVQQFKNRIARESIVGADSSKKLLNLFNDLPKEFAETYCSIVKKRNSLNHFGYSDREHYYKWMELDISLENLYEEIQNHIYSWK
ncbi:MAG: TIGR02221 family CRISPR-associated protein [Eubacterium sp.]|nr:TIGR02221 family CRISPR-associated protein [Eubacterium sp.]